MSFPVLNKQPKKPQVDLEFQACFQEKLMGHVIIGIGESVPRLNYAQVQGKSDRLGIGIGHL